MRRHSVDVVPLVLLRKTPNEGPEHRIIHHNACSASGDACAISLHVGTAPDGAGVDEPPGYANAGMLLRRCASLTPTCNFPRPCGAAASAVMGNNAPRCCAKPAPPSLTSAVKAQASSISDTSVARFRHVGVRLTGAPRWCPPCAGGSCRCSGKCRVCRSGMKSSRWYPAPRSETARCH